MFVNTKEFDLLTCSTSYILSFSNLLILLYTFITSFLFNYFDILFSIRVYLLTHK